MSGEEPKSIGNLPHPLESFRTPREQGRRVPRSQMETYEVRIRVKDLRNNQVTVIITTNKFEDLYQNVASQMGLNLDEWNMILSGIDCETINSIETFKCVLDELIHRPRYTITMLLAPRPLAISAPSVGGSRKHSRKTRSNKAGSKKAGSKKAGSKKAGSKKAGSKKAGSKKVGYKKAGSKKRRSKKL